jgi:amino acid adenylation domain-containing protein
MNKPGSDGALSESKQRLLELYLRGRTAGTQAAAEQPSDARSRGEPAPLSLEQELIWVHSKLAPHLPLYNEIVTVRRTGPLDVPALERSLTEVARRHEAWRTTYDEVGGEVVQIVQPPPQQFSLPVTDLSALPEEEREREAFRLATEETQRPLDLARGLPVRAKLVRMEEGVHRLFVVMHHLVHDGVSVYSVFLPELAALYEAFAAGKPSPLPELDVQYADYARRQRRELREQAPSASLDYWRRQLAGAPRALELATDHPRPSVQRFLGRQETFTLTQSLTDALRRFSQREQATLFVTLLAAFNVLLYRHTGQEDLLVGTVMSTRKGRDVEKLLGVFLNTIVLRTRVTESLTFRQVLANVRKVIVDGLAHGDVPFHHLVRELQPKRDASRSPLFQTSFIFEPPMPSPGPGWDMTQWSAETGVARTELAWQMDDRPDGLVGQVRYNTDLWEPPTVRTMIDRFKLLLEEVVADAEMTVSAIPILTPSERVAPAVDPGAVRPSNPFARFEDQEIEQSIPLRFAKQVARHGTRVAVRDGANEWTYVELDQAANRVARALVDAQVAAGNRVAVLLEHDAPLIAGVLGVLKSGAAYVALEAAHPEARLRQVMADANASALLATRKHLALARELAPRAVPILAIEDLLSAPPAPDYGSAVSPDQLAYLLYTSGSTGKPKGVAQNHRNVLHFIAAYTNNLHLCADDRLTLLASCGVDAFVMDVFGALLNGATLCPIDVRDVGLGGVRERLVRDRITVYHSTPTLFRHFARELSGHPQPAAVRLVVLGGEEARVDDIAAWREHFAPDCLFVNGFGLTESSVSLQYFLDRTTNVERGSVPIGRPVERTAVMLLSRGGRPGQVHGEIALRSPHVSVGYWQNRELTEAAFVSDSAGGKDRIYKTGDMGRLLPDGNIEFLGRRDLQTKLQGFRVEIGEVEAALSQIPGVAEAAARVMDHEGSEKRLIAYYAAPKDAAPSPDELRRVLRGRLPGYMIPSAFVRLDALPLTPTGKVDRLALPAPETRRPEQDPADPSDGVERDLLAIWTRVLGTDRIGIRDDFFDLGGHSVLALRIMAEIQDRFGVNLPLAKLLEAPTVEQLAEVVRPAADPLRREAVVTIRATQGLPPFVRSLAERLGLRRR